MKQKPNESATGILPSAQNSTPKLRILKLPAVMSVSGLGRSSIYDRMKKKAFPAALPLGEGAHAVGWLEHEVLAWVESLIAARNATA